MSIIECLRDAAKQGELDLAYVEEYAADTQDLLENLEKDRFKNMDPQAAEAFAIQAALKHQREDAARKRTNSIKQAVIVAGHRNYMDAYRVGEEKTPALRRALNKVRSILGVPAKVAKSAHVGRAAMSLLTRDVFDQSGVRNVEIQHKAVLGQIHSRAEAFLSESRPRWAGLTRKLDPDNLVKELFGESTGDEAAKLASEAWRTAAEYARKRFNLAGGDIKFRLDWGLPQTHDQLSVADVDRNQWVDYILPLLDRKQMIDPMTGAPYSDARLVDGLHVAYDNISTGGLATKKLGQKGNKKGLANTHQEVREFIFLDGDSWKTYQQRFGSADIYESMNNHLDNLASEIARMEVLGPNPDATVAFMIDYVKLDASGKGRAAHDASTGMINAIQGVYGELTGESRVAAHAGWARGFQAVRSMLTSAQLGSAIFPAIFGDMATQRITRGFNGLPVMTRDIPQLLKLMIPQTIEDQKFAVRAGLVADNWTGSALAMRRYTGEIMGPKWANLFADVTLRVSGLSPFTQAGRWAFGLEFLGHLGDFKGKMFDDMPVATQAALERYGIKPSDWQKASTIDLLNHKGSEFLDVVAMDEKFPDVARKLQQMILSETEFAVPSGSARVRHQLRGGTKPGSFVGELVNSVAMYKTFPVSIIHLHIMRGLQLDTNLKSLRYLSNFFISATVMGAFAWQAKRLSKGQDPQPMNTPEFLMQAMIQGGGLGMFGDFVLADTNRYGYSLGEQVAGPVVNFLGDVSRLTSGNIRELTMGEDTGFAAEAVKFTKRYQPMGSLWFSRAAMEHMVYDQLERWADPNAPSRWRRYERSLKSRSGGAGPYWRRGKILPDRAPDFKKAIGK